MKVLIIGGGGRAHAIAWKIAQSHRVTEILVAPGNAGTRLEDKIKNIAIEPTDIDSLTRLAEQNDVDITIVGPEAPLAAGIVDAFDAKGLPCFGPTQRAAELESSKAFCKNFLREHNIPTAAYATFTDSAPAIAYLDSQSFPLVIKADGLAAGKGVIIAQTHEQAEQAIHDMLDNQQFGYAGQQIIIEEFLEGRELSYIVMADGKNILPLASSQDYKRRDNEDQGPNTGGMGAISPSPILTQELEQTILEQVIRPTIAAMAAQGRPYTGFLYAGLMVTDSGEPKVLEYNCRLGDPETQPLMMRLQSDLLDCCLAALDGTLDTCHVEWDPRPATCVIMTAGGYPVKYRKGDVIQGLESRFEQDTKVFHAGTTHQDEQIITNGGRVLGITSLGETYNIARDRTYAAINLINWDDCYFRTDIGKDAIND